MNQGSIENWLAALHAPGVGAAKFHKLLQYDPQLAVLPAAIQPDMVKVERDLTWASLSSNRHIITFNDPRYPQLLKTISHPPPVLFVEGLCESLNRPQVAIVGSRSPSHHGLRHAHRFAVDLVGLGLVVTSGLALGVDIASHKGALAASGETIAVLGGGLNHIYPKRHQAIAHEIMERGCIVSEFSPDTKPLPQYFPRRNRIISGLSMGVLVVEAALKSGSLIAAQAALEQGREVFAVPGSILCPKSQDCHALIKQGAKLVESVGYISEELGGLLKYVNHDTKRKAEKGKLPKSFLKGQKATILSLVDYEMTPIDIVVGRSGLEIGQVNAMLLKLDGYITSVPGGYVRKSG